MPVISLRYKPAELAALRAYAAAHDVPLSTAIKQLAQQGLQAGVKPQAESAGLEQCTRLLRLGLVYQYALYLLARVHDASSEQPVLDQVQEQANQHFAKNPDLFGGLRFPAPRKPPGA